MVHSVNTYLLTKHNMHISSITKYYSVKLIDFNLT